MILTSPTLPRVRLSNRSSTLAKLPDGAHAVACGAAYGAASALISSRLLR
jgi:hypothetical protein